MRRFAHALRRDDGLAMVTALLVTFVVFMMSIVVIRQAIHNVDASGRDQRRLRTVTAAEAGLNWAYNQLEYTEVADLWEGTGSDPLSIDVGSGPVEVDVDVTYYEDEEGFDPYDMSNPSAANPPQSLKITSTGVTPTGVERTMESFAVLNPVYGGLDGAVISNGGLSLSNNFNLSGNSGNDGDIIIESGNFSAPSGVEQIRGSIYVRSGTASITTNSHIYGSVWANGTVTLNQPQLVVDGDVKSTTGAITMTQGSVGGNGYYCTTVGPNASKILGTKVHTCSLGPPPTFGFPLIQFSQTAWEAQGFYVKDFGTGASVCNTAFNWLSGIGNGTYNKGTPISGGVPVGGGYTGVVVLMANCRFDPPASFATMEFATDLAIVSRGGTSSGSTTGAINLSRSTSWTGLGGTRDLFFISPYDGSSRHCTSGGDGSQNVTLGNLNRFTSAEVSVYTVCTASVSNNNTFPGQIIGHTTQIQGNFTMSYRPVLIPGSDVVGFEQDVAYIREVA